MREVHIKKVMNGYIVTVGCQTLVFEDRERLLDELDKYLTNPEAVEKDYVSTYGQVNPTPPPYPQAESTASYPITGNLPSVPTPVFTGADSAGPSRNY